MQGQIFGRKKSCFTTFAPSAAAPVLERRAAGARENATVDKKVNGKRVCAQNPKMFTWPTQLYIAKDFS